MSLFRGRLLQCSLSTHDKPYDLDLIRRSQQEYYSQRDRMIKTAAPRIACIGAEALTASHGTGQMFARHFSEYPRSKIIDIYTRSHGQDFLFPNVSVSSHDLTNLQWKSPQLSSINACIKGGVPQPQMSLVYQNLVFDPVNINWEQYGGPPEIIYSTCYSAKDFAFLHHVYRYLPKKVPIVQHFLDLDLWHFDTMVALYFELLPAIVDLWVLTKPIYDVVSRFSFQRPEIVQALQQPLPEKYKRNHNRFSENFRAVMIGNVWSGSAYLTLRDLWSRCQRSISGLKAISWMGHPRRSAELGRFNLRLSGRDSIVKDAGFLPQRELKRTLREADIALIAFSGDQMDKKDYVSYSLPSRLGDYCAHGLPVVVISRPGTEPWRLVEENELGIAIDPSDRKLAVRKLKHFILDEEWRAECSRKSLDFARRELDLKTYQAILYPRLAKYARSELPLKILESRFGIQAPDKKKPSLRPAARKDGGLEMA